MFGDHYCNRRVLITGHTGFKGSWLAMWLHELGAKVGGFSDRAPKQPSLFQVIDDSLWSHDLRGDVADAGTVRKVLRRVKPDVIFHLAAQPLVRESYQTPVDTMRTNVMGTAVLLDSVRELRLPSNVVVVTSDKCYDNRETSRRYRETDSLGGHDPYSVSKGAAELMVQSWRRSFFEPDQQLGNVASARGGNVIGGGDYAADRIVPDCVRSLRSGEAIRLRNPGAVRPWQHVLDCLSGYLLLGSRLGKDPDAAAAFNFGPARSSDRSVRDLVEEVLQHWPGRWEDASWGKQPHEASLLHLSTTKAQRVLGWKPVWNFRDSVRHSIEWYRRRHGGGRHDMEAFSREQIRAYAAAAKA